MHKITIGDYKGLATDTNTKFNENDLNVATIEATIKLVNDWAKNNVPADIGDEVIVTFTAVCENTFVPELSQSNFKYAVGNPSMIEQFNQVMGKKAGEIFEMQILFSEDAPIERIRSKNVLFNVSVQEVIHHRRIQPSDKIAIQIDPTVSGLSELQIKLKDTIKENWQKVITQKRIEFLLETIIMNSSFILEQEDLDSVYNHIINVTRHNMMSSGDPGVIQTLLDEQNDEFFYEDCMLLAEKVIKEELILNEIAHLERIQVLDRELTDAKQQLLEQIGKQSFDAMFPNEESLEKHLVREKTLKLLLDLNS